MQTMHYDDIGGIQIFRLSKGSCPVIIDRLHDMFPARKTANMFRHEREIISVGMQRGNTRAQACLPIQGVIIVEAEMDDTITPKNLYHSIRKRGFPGAAITTERDD